MNKLILFSIIAFSGCNAAEKYTASDCITRIQFHWGDESGRDKATIISAFMDDFIKQYTSEADSELPPPSTSVQGSDREFIFLQYTENCDAKIETTKSIVDQIIKGTISYPRVSFTEESFEPSDSTIMITGPYWKSE
ncbi:hypothetical protein [Aliiglaciecola litoralis]|uniref:Uncharacterized protein n=1 Tax=Aliiglaciecola litoralis TaxID=582857 RepID=A0ABP3WLL1_9ALTE